MKLRIPRYRSSIMYGKMTMKTDMMYVAVESAHKRMYYRLGNRDPYQPKDKYYPMISTAHLVFKVEK